MPAEDDDALTLPVFALLGLDAGTSSLARRAPHRGRRCRRRDGPGPAVRPGRAGARIEDRVHRGPAHAEEPTAA
ncbi:hypothetical protein LV779_21170 [Streptomyces thinghirensis]|nr:hypothetical protein [Streptomyces thinghirensis]